MQIRIAEPSGRRTERGASIKGIQTPTGIKGWAVFVCRVSLHTNEKISYLATSGILSTKGIGIGPMMLPLYLQHFVLASLPVSRPDVAFLSIAKRPLPSWN
jgi:hypothetical protein